MELSRTLKARHVAMISLGGIIGAGLFVGSSAAMLLLYFLIGAAQIRHRKAMTRTQVDALSLKMWLFPWASYAAQGGILSVLIAMAFFEGLASQLYTTMVFVAVLWLSYFALRKTNAYAVKVSENR